MFSEATLLLGGIILFALGAIIGALIYHLIEPLADYKKQPVI